MLPAAGECARHPVHVTRILDRAADDDQLSTDGANLSGKATQLRDDLASGVARGNDDTEEKCTSRGRAVGRLS